MFQAAGYEQRQIAHVMNVSAKTVSRWQHEPKYAELVAELRERQSEIIEPLVHRIRVEMGDAVRKAINTLLDNLTATNKDGRPNYNVRQAAAQTLIGSAKLIAGDEMQEGAGSNGSGQEEVTAGPTTIVFNLPEGADKEVAWRPAAIEGSAEEVE